MFSDQLENFIPDLRAYARVLCGDPTQADDIVQNACLNAWQKREQFDSVKGPLRGWLFRIVRNEFYQQKRADRVREADPIDQMETEPVAACDLEKRSDLNRILQAVESLKTAQRDAFLLVAAAGFTYEEAADVLDCAPGTVKSRVSRAREMAFGLYHSEEWDAVVQPKEASPLKQLHESLNRIQSVPHAA